MVESAVARRCVLVVDDDAFVRQALARELAEFDVVEAGNYAQALRCLAERPDISVVVTDCDFGSGPNGIELLKHVRMQAPHVARIMVSASIDERTGRELVVAGLVRSFHTKPWAHRAVLVAVEECPLSDVHSTPALAYCAKSAYSAVKKRT